MINTISNIGTEINSIISKTNVIAPLSNQERIDKFLDGINTIRAKLVNQTERLKKLDHLFTQVTWLDISNAEEEKLLKDVIAKSKRYHSKSIQNFATLKTTLWQKNICRSEIIAYKESLDDFEDTIFEVEQIFFSLRNDQELNDLLNSI
jgi:hypothetical protein